MAKKSKTYERLRSLGYDRAENSENQVQHKTLRAENYASMMLNHMIMDHVTMENCDFTEACATGSIFRHCKFKNCELNQSDFEFCEFYNCEFESKTPILCSFNNSSFSNTDFHNIIFRNCTLTGALFTRCCWDGGKIWNSTLEGAKFRQCTFLKIDFRGLNMDYIELEKPYMDNVVLPLDQIPFMFGCLKYLRVTTDAVKISKGETGTITIERFWNEIIDLLCKHFQKTEQYFPLANIYYANNRPDDGMEAIKKGLIAAIAISDFRMLKYYCKLMAYSNALKPGALHYLYNNYICRLLPQNAEGLDIPSYARNMLEIKELLFNTSKQASFRISLKTNISLFENQKLGKLFESVFSVGKQRGVFRENEIEAVLQQNSPLIITIRVTGDEAHLAPLLSAYLTMIGMPAEEQRTLPVISQYYRALPEKTGYAQEVNTLGLTYNNELREMAVETVLLEYYVENFTIYVSENEPIFYFNHAALTRERLLPD